ncbi:MAG: C1 family peptidase, partial [Saprospiraceae bacterium]
MKTYQLIFLMIYLPLFNYGQNTLNNCLINENTDKFYDEVLSSYFPKSSSCRSSELPLRVSLKKYCPEVRQQDETSSNVGWAVGYSAMTITYAKQYEWTTEEINENALSPTFLSSQLRDKDCQAVFGIGEVLELASHRGNVFYKEFDAIYGYCNAHVSVFKMKPTYLFKLKDYLTLFSLNAYNKQKIYNTKKSISEGKPVIIGMKVLKNFENLTKKTPYWNPNIGDTNVLGGHAMVVVGYDESRGAFEVMNSWGKNWGNDGFIYIKYADYAK